MARKISDFALNNIFVSIAELGSSRKQIIAASGYSQSIVNDATTDLLAQGRIYVVDWITYREPILAPGNEPNAPRPRLMTQNERQRRYRRKYKAVIKAKRRAKDQLDAVTGIWTALLTSEQLRTLNHDIDKHNRAADRP
jgi:hypothetical protein